MTELEKEALEQAAKPQKWGSRERMALVAEILRLKRMVRWFAEYLAEAEADDEITPEHWIWQAEQAVKEEISPKEQV